MKTQVSNQQSINSSPISPVQKKGPSGCLIVFATIGCIGLLISLCVGSILIGGTSLLNAILGEYTTINQSTLQKVCESKTSLTQDQYASIFTESYRSKYSYDIAKATIIDVFPTGYDCNNLTPTSLLDLLSKGISINISSTIGISKADISFNTSDGKRRIEFLLIKTTTGDWQIDEILETSYVGSQK